MIWLFKLDFSIMAFIGMTSIIVVIALWVYFRTAKQQRLMQTIIYRKQNEKELETAQRISGEFLHQKVINGRLAPHIRQLEELETLVRRLNNPQLSEITEKIQRLKQEVQETRDVVRDISRHIFPPFLSYLFVESCQRKLNELADLYPNNGEILLESEGHFTDIDLSVLYNLYNIITNFVTNSLQNAHAKHINVSVRRTPQSIILKISDNGIGFDFEEVSKTTKGIGIAEIQGRANILATQFIFQSGKGKGTRFEITIQLSPA